MFDNLKASMGRWLTLEQYALYRNVSDSTVRRMIKSDKVKYELRSGKYFVWVSYYKGCDALDYRTKIADLEKSNQALLEKIKKLEFQLETYREMIALSTSNGLGSRDELKVKAMDSHSESSQ